VAAYKGQKEVVEYLLAKPGLLKDPVDNWGITPLMLAASAGHAKVMEVLLAAGCDFKLKSGDGSTALHRAAAQGHLTAVELLLAAGANPNLVDGKGKSPLELAESKKKGDWQSVVSKLKQASAESQP
jgi:ankyrin repeat protein